jgi:glycosyltransferase EpsF
MVAGENDHALRVAHVIGSVCKGGVENVVFNYYRAIDKDRVQFDFIIDEDSPCEIPNDIMALGCRVYKIPSYKHLPAYIRELNKILSGYHIVHSHMNTLSVFTLFAAKQAGVPVRIAHSHSTLGKGEFKRNIMKTVLRPFSRLYPTLLLACSEHAGRWLFGDKAFDKGRVKVIRNAINVNRFQFNLQTRERVRRDLGISEKLVIGHAGRFMAQKNHLFLLDIFKEVHDQRQDSVLMLVGDGELRTAAEERVKQYGLSDCVLFLGLRDDVHELYQAMDVFVLPSLYEGLGMVAVEAQCAGLPCVLSDQVPKEAKILDDVIFLPLTAGKDKWAQAVCEIKHKRGNYSEEIAKADYEILGEAKNLVRLYYKISGLGEWPDNTITSYNMQSSAETVLYAMKK